VAGGRISTDRATIPAGKVQSTKIRCGSEAAAELIFVCTIFQSDGNGFQHDRMAHRPPILKYLIFVCFLVPGRERILNFRFGQRAFDLGDRPFDNGKAIVDNHAAGKSGKVVHFLSAKPEKILPRDAIMISDPRFGTVEELEIQRFALEELVERQRMKARPEVPALGEFTLGFKNGSHHKNLGVHWVIDNVLQAM
jgi:hypothetical protein